MVVEYQLPLVSCYKVIHVVLTSCGECGGLQGLKFVKNKPKIAHFVPQILNTSDDTVVSKNDFGL